VAEDSPSSLADRILITLTGNIFPPAAALVMTPILARSLGVDGRGQLASVISPYLLLVTLASFGVPEAVTYFVASNPQTARIATRWASLIACFTGAAVVVALVALRGWLSDGNAELAQLILIAACAIVPAVCLGVVRGTASGLHLWRLVAAERLLTSVGMLAAVIVVAGTGKLTVTVATLIITLVPVVGVLAYCPLLRELRPSTEPSTTAAPGAILGYGSRIWLGAVSGILLVRLDQALMNPIAGAHELGLYVVAVSISEIPLIVNSTVRDVTFADQAASSSPDILAASARISSSACAAIGAALLLLLPFLVPYTFGADFTAAVPVAAILIVAVVIGTPGSVAGAGLSGRGRPGLRSASLAVACVANLILMVILVPKFGAIGAAWATMAGNSLAASLNIVFLRIYFDVPPSKFLGLRRDDGRLVRRAGRILLGRIGGSAHGRQRKIERGHRGGNG